MTQTPASPALSEADQAMREAWAYLTPHWLTNGPVVLDGPKMRAAVATIRARATAAEEERDEETARRHKHQRDWSESFRQLSEAWQHEIRENDANLIALAKMYGEACGRLHHLGFLMAENVVIEVVEDDEQGRELLAGIEAIAVARDAAEATLREREAEIERLRAGLKGILPGKLCGESWGLPDTERMPIQTTLGALKAARAALAQPATPASHDEATR